MERWIVITPALYAKFESCKEAQIHIELNKNDNLNTQPVRIFNEEELKEFAWKWFSKCNREHKHFITEKQARIEFEQLYEKEKENENESNG
jgi:hypothetical protein